MARSAIGDSLIKAAIIENAWLSEKYYRISFEVPADYLEAGPGQFVMLRVDMRPDPLLGRPFSIYSVYKDGPLTACSVLYRVVGKMTDLLSRKVRGECVHVLGPLGRGFDLSAKFSKADTGCGRHWNSPNLLPLGKAWKIGQIGSDLLLRREIGAGPGWTG